MKTKFNFLGFLILFLISEGISQNTSFDANAVPILSGNGNTAFGPQALFYSGASSNDNVANGFQALLMNNGRGNVAVGHSALLNNTSGGGNVATGAGAMLNNVDGYNNVAIGGSALPSNIGGHDNVALGGNALYLSMGNYNTACGSGALANNTVDENTAIGFQSLLNNTSGSYNVASGFKSLFSNSTGQYNTANGYQALFSNTADGNTATGYQSLFSNSTGQYNVASGYQSLYSNSTGHDNVAMGYQAMLSNQTNYYNVAIGTQALMNSNGSNANVAIGYQSLFTNSTAGGNVALGYQALFNNNTGYLNCGLGSGVLINNNTGFQNCALGGSALAQNTSGSQNVAIGSQALYFNNTGGLNTGVGAICLGVTTGTANSALGWASDLSYSNMNDATAIGSAATVNGDSRVWLGSPTATVWTTNSYNISDGTFKKNIREDNVKGLEFIKLLRPVTYNFDAKLFTEHVTKNMPDSIRALHMKQNFERTEKGLLSGFIAQEVAEAAKKSNYDFSGVYTPDPGNNTDTYGLSYYQFVVPLVKAVQEQQAMIETQKQKNQDLEKQLEEQKQMITQLQQKAGITTGLNSTTFGASEFKMEQNEPNPFSHETTIRYNLPGQVNNAYMAIYDLSGKQVKTLPLEQKGNSSIVITADQLAAGIYIYSIIADGKIMDSKRMVVADK